jgi:glycosyltransferase involved in cell wall biosynthesis
MSSSLFCLQYYARVARDMKRKGIEVVHIHSFPQAAAIIRFLHPSAKLVVHLHVEWLNLLPANLARRQLQDVDLVLCCSDYLSERTRRSLPDSGSKIRTLHNAVDTNLFTEVTRCPQAERGARKILFVGRISPEKGLHILLAAFESLLEKGEDLYLDIVGPDLLAPPQVIVNISDTKLVAELGQWYDQTPAAKAKSWLRVKFPRRLKWLPDTTYRGRLRAMVQGRMIGRVRFQGFVSNDELPQWYREADLFVLPSVYETFGIPLIEAMACGTAVLATRTGGVPEIVQDEVSGLLVEPGDVEQLAKGIGRLMQDDVLRQQMGQRGRKRAMERFSWNTTVQPLIQEYAALHHR